MTTVRPGPRRRVDGESGSGGALPAVRDRAHKISAGRTPCLPDRPPLAARRAPAHGGDDGRVPPDNPAFLDSLGWVRFRRGDAAGAMPYLERAYRIFPDAEIASHWGEILWVSGKQSEARALWARSLARSPDSKPLRATIERLTGTKLEPPEKTSAPEADDSEPEKLPQPDNAPASTGS